MPGSCPKITLPAPVPPPASADTVETTQSGPPSRCSALGPAPASLLPASATLNAPAVCIIQSLGAPSRIALRAASALGKHLVKAIGASEFEPSQLENGLSCHPCTGLSQKEKPNPPSAMTEMPRTVSPGCTRSSSSSSRGRNVAVRALDHRCPARRDFVHVMVHLAVKKGKSLCGLEMGEATPGDCSRAGSRLRWNSVRVLDAVWLPTHNGNPCSNLFPCPGECRHVPLRLRHRPYPRGLFPACCRGTEPAVHSARHFQSPSGH